MPPRSFNTHTLQTLTGLRSHGLYKQLSDPQKAFLDTFIRTGGNRIEAAKAAYVCKDEKSASTLASRLLRQPAIQSLLALFYDYEQQRSAPLTKRELMTVVSTRLVRKDISNSAFAQLADLLARLSGWTQEPAQEPEPNIDALVRELEKQKGKQQ